MTEHEAEVKHWWDGLSTAARLLLKDVTRPIAYYRLDDEEKKALKTYYDKFVEKRSRV